jgi:two-component system, LytTR family, response regulator
METAKHCSCKQQVFLRDGAHCWIVVMHDIRLLESAGNYTRVHFGGNSPLICRSLNDLEGRLDPAIFFRASRSHIVNLRQIRSLDKGPDGGLVAMLADGTKVSITRRQSQKLRERLTF